MLNQGVYYEPGYALDFTKEGDNQGHKHATMKVVCYRILVEAKSLAKLKPSASTCNCCEHTSSDIKDVEAIFTVLFHTWAKTLTK